jgi:hypothetical protein
VVVDQEERSFLSSEFGTEVSVFILLSPLDSNFLKVIWKE